MVMRNTIGWERLVGPIGCLVVCLAPHLAAEEIGNEAAMTYKVRRTRAEIPIDAGWDSAAWRDVATLQLSHFMGDRPAHLPKVETKVQYDDMALYLHFRVADRYVRAVTQEHQGGVFYDSCVEFFFTPGTDVKQGYFNLEMNCGGTMLFHFQRQPRKNQQPLAADDVAKVEVAHSLPKLVDPEITEPTTWTVSYRLPTAILSKYFPVDVAMPAAGVTWRANFYKCADATSHPHWLTWSKIERDRPDFHRPEWFGTLEFE